MPHDMYLKVEGINGESKDARHSGWTDIISFAWGIAQNANNGSSVGKVNFSDLHVTALIDKSVTALIKYCATGKHVNKVELSLCRASDDQIEYARITLEDVLVTSVDYGGVNKNDELSMTYSFQAAKVRQQYWEQTRTGQRGAETAMGWDIKANCEV